MAIDSSVIHGFITPVLAGMGVLASLICTFFLVWGGIAYVTSSGNPNKLTYSKRIISRALLGLVVVLAASAISLLLIHAYAGSSTSSAQKLPILTAVKPTKSSGGLVGVLISAITGMLKDIVETIGKPFILAISYFTKSTPLLTHNPSVVHLWIICTGIADSLLAVVIALIGFHIMGGEHLGLRGVSLRTFLPQLILAVVLINTSIYILDGAIELSNAMIVAVRSAMGGLTPWQSLLNVVAGASGFSLAALVIFVIFLALTVILLIYYIGRIIVLYLGAILSPLVIVLWLLPGFRDFAENALKTYLATVFVLFVHVIILCLAGSLFAGVVKNGSGAPDPVMSLLLGMAALIALIKTQGVLMQLNYASLSMRSARRLGGSFVNGVSYLALSARYTYSNSLRPAISVAGESVRNLIPEPKPKVYQPESKNKEKRGKD